MSEVVEDKLSIRNFLAHIQTFLDRYASNQGIKKVLLFPLLVLCFILLFGLIGPMMILSVIVLLVFRLIDSITDKGGFMMYLPIFLFFEFYILLYVLFLYFLIIYGIIDLAALGLGKTIYDVPGDRIMKPNNEPRKEEKTENIYVINDEDFK